ncbi:MAG: carboxyl transferase [Lachnospiraceae bacterium]|nr:carboxyl transferase [Lachnospiraceae bacterium]
MGNASQTPASKRIADLLDDSSFVEVGAFVAARSTDFHMAEKATPGDGVVTGYGTIGGQLVYVFSQDATVLGGSLGEMHAKKIAHLYTLALKMGAPVIGLLDSAGLRLEEATDALHGFGKWYLAQTKASGVVPQITAVFGHCGGGLALAAGLSDFVLMESKSAKLFVNSPNAIPGNDASKCDNGGAKFQSDEAGLVDFAGTESEVLELIRELVGLLPANNEDDQSYTDCDDDLNRLCAGLENYAGDTGEALRIISDDRFFLELKPGYAKGMAIGFIRINGVTVGCVANRSETTDGDGKKESLGPCLTYEGCKKAARFVNFCDAFDIPILTLVNTRGYKSTLDEERHIASSAASLTYAFANATVPKVTVIVGDAFGSAYLVMNGKTLGADVVYAWPTAQIATMDAQAAAKILYADEIAKSDNAVSFIAEKAGQIAAGQSGAVSAAKRGYVDDIIEANQTRQRVAAAYEMLFTKREDRPAKKHGSL